MKICDVVYKGDEVAELCSAKVFSEGSGKECDLHPCFYRPKRRKRSKEAEPMSSLGKRSYRTSQSSSPRL